MIYPILNTYESPKYPVKGFYGINRKKKASVGECVDCLNVNGDEFPVLRSVRGNDGIIHSESEITKILPPESGEVKLLGIVGGEVTGFGEFEDDSDEYSKLVDNRARDILKIGDKLVTVPNFCVYNPNTKKYKSKKISTWYSEYSSTTSTKKNKVSFDNASNCYKIGCRAITNEEAMLLNKKISHLRIDDYGDVYEWSANEDYLVIVKVNINSSAIGFEDDYITVKYYTKTVSGYEVSRNDVLDKIISNGITDSYEYYITLENEDIPLACVLNNRVWGVSGDGRQIRCSKLGAPNVFSSYNDGAASSWFCEVGSEGKFTGIIPYNNAIFAFKESCVHVVYGTIPQNFSLEKTFEECGCIDGKSIQIVNNALYWLGYNGIYRYAGGTPKVISDNLNKKYKACVSFTDNEKLYLNLTDLDGNKEFLSYDTRNGLWHKYTYLDVLGGFLYDGNLYAYTKNDIYKMFSGDFGEWNFTGVLEYNDNLQNNSTTDLYIMAEMKAGSEFTVEYKGISESDWEYCGKYVADKDCVIKEHFKMRVRHDSAYNLRISGNGEAYIYEMLKTTPGSGFKEI